MRLYIAGPISNPDPRIVEANIHRARVAMVELIRKGHSPFCPHTMSANCEDANISREEWLRVDLDWLYFAEGIVMLEGWEASEGACTERLEAVREGIPVFYGVEEVEAAG
jgi:hypothetical protein